MKTYVITGATSGIGKALTEELSKENLVFAGYRNEALRPSGKNIIPFYIDMEKKYSVAGAAEFIKSQTDRIDTLINAAGCVIAGACENLSLDKIRLQFEINTFSHLDFSQRLLDLLEGGKIINISSMASFGIFPFVAPYCSSKRALDILFNSMSLEMKRNIKVISVKPGVIATPLWSKSVEVNREVIKNPSVYEKEMKYLVKSARENEHNGLPVKKVLDLIVKIDRCKSPKPSYTIGADAKFAEICAKLPQQLLNKFIKLGLFLKIK